MRSKRKRNGYLGTVKVNGKGMNVTQDEMYEVIRNMLRKAKDLGLDPDSFKVGKLAPGEAEQGLTPDAINVTLLKRELMMLEDPKQYQKLYIDSSEDVVCNMLYQPPHKERGQIRLEGVEVGKKFPRDFPEHLSMFVEIYPEGLALCSQSDKAERLDGYGLCVPKEFPYGLMMWSFESDESPEGHQELDVSALFGVSSNDRKDCHILHDFLLLPKEKVELTQVLINKKGIVYDIIHCPLHPEYVQDLQAVWSNPSLDWSEYEDKREEYFKLIREGASFLDPNSMKGWIECDEKFKRLFFK